MGWVVLGVIVLLVVLLFWKARKRSGAASINNGPISRDGSTNYDNVQNQANSQQFRDGGYFG
jgi:hypothetical protein